MPLDNFSPGIIPIEPTNSLAHELSTRASRFDCRVSRQSRMHSIPTDNMYIAGPVVDLLPENEYQRAKSGLSPNFKPLSTKPSPTRVFADQPDDNDDFDEDDFDD